MAAVEKSHVNSEIPSAAKGTCRADTSPLSSFAQAIEPMPVPMANTASSKVSTCPSACSVSRAITGNSVSSVAPTVQNHDSPSRHSQIGRTCRAWRITSSVSAKMLTRTGSVGSAGAADGTKKAATSPISAMANPVMPTSASPFGNRMIRPPITVPVTIAMNVEASIMPFPATSSFSARCSGSTPYLSGLNNVA